MELPEHHYNQLMDGIVQYLDGGLSPEDEQKFLTEIKQYPDCLKKLEIEQTFKEFICDKVSRKSPDPDFLANLKTQINQYSNQ